MKDINFSYNLLNRTSSHFNERQIGQKDGNRVSAASPANNNDYK